MLGAPPPAAFIAVVIMIGVALRLEAYLQDRTLWLDEAMLARNILNRSMAELMRPLAYAQGAPLAYLAIDKLAVLGFGRNEYALRLVSILSGIGALAVFALVSTRTLNATARVVACACIALCPTLIYYSAEAKQYSSDVLVSTVLLYCATKFGDSESLRGLIVLAVVGAIALWLSHPAVFVLGTVGVAMAWTAARVRTAKRILDVCIVGSVWFGSLTVLYFTNLRSLVANNQLQAYWSTGFMPVHPRAALEWLGRTYWSTFSSAFGQTAGIFMAWLFALGVISTALSRNRIAWLLVGPYILLLVASGLHLYPFEPGRLILFSLPVAIIGSGFGWQVVSSLGSRVVTLTLTVLLFSPLPEAAFMAAGTQREDLRPLIQQMAQQVHPGDRVYVYAGAEPQFTLYADDLGYLPRDIGLQVVIGSATVADVHAFEAELRPLRSSGRVWLIVSHQYSRNVPDGEELLSVARSYGQEILTFASPTASSVRLFTFDRP